VQEGETVAEVTTDKVDVEVPCSRVGDDRPDRRRRG